ncbi:hypothetical protein M758_UG275800 [Ceratodon purpureus]|nr:hypothetical protein M758_UG275800 [Ceratodon purpureus]
MGQRIHRSRRRATEVVGGRRPHEGLELLQTRQGSSGCGRLPRTAGAVYLLQSPSHITQYRHRNGGNERCPRHFAKCFHTAIHKCREYRVLSAKPDSQRLI